MSTRTFTLEEAVAALHSAIGDHVAAKVSIVKGFEAALLAAKPEAKTCETCHPLCGKVGFWNAPSDFYEGIKTSTGYCTDECAKADRPLNPAPAASPPACPEWCGTGECPEGAEHWGEETWCSKECARMCRKPVDRAKAVPRDTVKVTVTRTGPPPNATWNGQDVYIPPSVTVEPSRPVTGEEEVVGPIECTSGNFRYRYMRFVGDVQQGSNDKVNWVQTRPAPGKPDEAPLSYLLEDATPHRLSRYDLDAFRDRAAALEAKLAEVRDEYAQQRFRLDRATQQLATRDSRIAGLEADASAERAGSQLLRATFGARDDETMVGFVERLAKEAADKAAAVLEERERCLAWTMSYGKVKRTLDGARAGIMGGAPAPTGGK